MGEEWRRGWHPERIRPKSSDEKVLVVGAGPAGLEAAQALGKRGYEVVLAEASGALGGRVAREARLPGLSPWIRVLDYRKGQLDRLPNVEIALGSRLDAAEILSYDFDHVALATGSRWRTDGIGRWHTRPLELAGIECLTPDDLMAGSRPQGPRVVLFDDDHYYLGGVLAELLATERHEVTLVTPEPRVSEWTVNTMEQHRIQRRLLELGVTVLASHAVISAEDGAVRTACVYTEREQELACDALVLVTSRLPEDGLAAELEAALEDRSGPVVRLIGDAWSPGTIAAAVWDGHRYAEELDEPVSDRDEPPFLREVVALAPLGGSAE
jgi:dimethylamine/trimethylamine dehydrogenase